MAAVYMSIFFGVSKAVDDTNKAEAASHTVAYTVSGDSTDATVTYPTFTDGGSGSSEPTNQKLPFSKTETVKGSSAGPSFNSFSITGTNGQTGMKITCTIKVDG